MIRKFECKLIDFSKLKKKFIHIIQLKWKLNQKRTQNTHTNKQHLRSPYQLPSYNNWQIGAVNSHRNESTVSIEFTQCVWRPQVLIPSPIYPHACIPMFWWVSRYAIAIINELSSKKMVRGSPPKNISLITNSPYSRLEYFIVFSQPYQKVIKFFDVCANETKNTQTFIV